MLRSLEVPYVEMPVMGPEFANSYVQLIFSSFSAKYLGIVTDVSIFDRCWQEFDQT